MTERRPLTEGIKPKLPMVNPELENKFVFGESNSPSAASNNVTQSPIQQHILNPNRVPFSTRMRGDLANALKRASLERQLKGFEPSSVQDILEQVIEPWLKSNGYLS